MKKIIVFSTIALLLAVSTFSQNQRATDNFLYKGFVDPGNVARPRVWWHWMNGNISKEGIRKDLEWMHRAGIGGFQSFEEGYATPQVVTKRMFYMAPEWKDAFRLATKLADSLGMEMGIAGSPGWSESGGPWVPGKDGMKKYVWSEIRVKGGQTFNGQLPTPPSNTGAFQNLPIYDPLSADMSGKEVFIAPDYSGDIATIAFKLPETDISMLDLRPKVTSSGGFFDLTKLIDGDLVTTQFLPKTVDDSPGWIQFEFDKPQMIKALTLVGGAEIGSLAEITGRGNTRTLQVSDDGQNFRMLIAIPAGKIAQFTFTIPPTKAKFFRITYKNPVPSMNLGDGQNRPVLPKGTEISKIVLHTVTKLNRFEEQAGFGAASFDKSFETPSTTDVIAETDVIDLTSQVKADGTLNWNVPAGNWKIVRFGYSLLGKTNHPASPEATGLEVDKLDPAAVRAYFTNYLNQYKEATGGLIGNKGLGYMINDSYEAGSQNWTPNLPGEFEKRRGYSMIPWMPVLTGEIIKNTETSERFLWDYRKTLAEMMAEYHYDSLTDILKEYGMKRYTESHEMGRAYIVDGMDVKRKAAIPMSAMWTSSFPINYSMDIRESASVAHIYGQNLVAAESFTSMGMFNIAYSFSPEKLKPIADLELANGVNRFVIQASVHQPVDDKIPGLSLGHFGHWFNRHETWAEQAKGWTDYLSRSSYMLQQGKFVADVVYYYGEDNNITNLFGEKPPVIPDGYNYDFINTDALVNLLEVKDGKLITPSGMSYRVLVLDSNARKMPLHVLRKISALVKGGATISGVKPETTPSLSDNLEEFNRLVNEIWGGQNARVLTDKPLNEVMLALNIKPDFEYTKAQSNTKLLYVHRKLIDRDIYWVNNRNNQNESIEATFRVTGKIPMIWHAETGKTEPASYKIENGRTSVTLNLTPNNAVFVVFQTSAKKTVFTLLPKIEKEVATVDGPWNVNFQPNRGAPVSATFNKLISYTENSDEGIKYFSGTATYSKTIEVLASQLVKGSQTWLDLGDVKKQAEVIVNGKSLGVIWKTPFRVNVTDILKKGSNSIIIKVTNLWTNRLIGD